MAASGTRAQPAAYRIDDLVLEPAARRVYRDGKPLKLPGLTFDLLTALAEAAPAVLTHDDISERVWKGRPVSPETIAQRAKMLRDALSDDARAPRYLELVRGQGYRLATEATPVSSTTVSRPSRIRWLALAGVSAVGLLALVLFVWSFIEPRRPLSVAVLPFVDVSPTGDQAYFADSVTTELINQLAQLEGLEVASRTASFTFREPARDLKAVGRQLGVTAILEGSVQHGDGDLRVAVQLIDVASGYDLWSASFDRELDDVLAVQTNLASSVVGALGVALGVGGINDFYGAGTSNIEAYEAFSRGDYRLATQLDPAYAAAWGRRGVRTAGSVWNLPPARAPEVNAKAFQYVEKARTLSPKSAQVRADYATVAHALLNWEAAQRAYEQALAIKRAPAMLMHYGDMLLRAGRVSSAVAVYDEAFNRDSVSTRATPLTLNVDVALNRTVTARAQVHRMHPGRKPFMNFLIELNSGTHESMKRAFAAMPHQGLLYSEFFDPLEELLDEPEQALRFLRALADDDDRMWPNKFELIALMAAYFGDPELSWQAFERELRNSIIRLGTVWYPVMADVRKLPGFKRFVSDAGLVDYWRRYGWADFCRPLDSEDFTCGST